MNKAEAEKELLKYINEKGLKGYTSMYGEGRKRNLYYCFNLENGEQRFWTNPSEIFLNNLGIGEWSGMTREEVIHVLKHIGDFIAIDDEYGLCYAPELVEALEIARKELNKLDLVHCKDCKYWEDENRKYNQADCACKRFSDDYKYTLEDDYCSYGEPKERKEK